MFLFTFLLLILTASQARLECKVKESGLTFFTEMSTSKYKEIIYGYSNNYNIHNTIPRSNNDNCKICYDKKTDKISYETNCSWNNIKQFYNNNKCISLANHVNKNEISSVSFWYIYCLNRLNSDCCPKPCNRGPCDNINYVKKPVQCINIGIHRDDFECKCAPDSIWSNTTKECHPINPCKNQSRCNGEQCKMIEHGYIQCFCGPNKMGENCEQARNPCIELIKPDFGSVSNLKSGNDQCKPGICIPTIGSNYYKCKCTNDTQDDRTSKFYPNCRIKIDPCSSIICYHGQCEKNHTYTYMGNQSTVIVKPYCKCNEGWLGEKCNLEKPKWTPWEEWSDCSPKCGLDRFRHRNRTCDVKDSCVTDDDSIGYMQKQTCSKHPCDLRHIRHQEKDDSAASKRHFKQIYFFSLFLMLLKQIL